jgi:tetratricopeptide (TPR) repeat protein
VYVVVLLYGALIYLGILGLRAKKVWSYAIWLYLVTILPISNLLIDYVVAFAERSMFTPSLGWIMLWVVGMGLGLEALERKGTLQSETIKSISKVGMTALLIVFSFLSVSRNTVWKDDLTLFSTDLKTHPESVRLNLLYAQELISKYPEQISGPPNPDLQKAKEALDAVQKISPDVPKCLLLQGHIAKLTGDNALAETYYQKTLALDDKNPSVYFNLGVMADIRQDYNTAKSMYLKSLELFPNYTSALSNLGIIYGREGNYDAAIEQIEMSVKLDPSNKTNYNNLAMAYQFKGDKIKAEYYRQKALEAGKPNK